MPRTRRPTVPFDLPGLLPILGPGGQVWSRLCNFDHPGTAVTAYAILFRRDDALQNVVATAYNGRLASSLAEGVHTLSAARPVADPARLLARLERDGYRIVAENPIEPEPAPEPEPEPAAEPTKRRGGRRKAETSSSTLPTRRNKKGAQA